MKIIYKPRGKGKTTQLLYSSDTTRIPILVATESQKGYLISEAQRLELNIPQPLSVTDIINGKQRGSRGESCYVDNAEIVLSSLISMKVAALTLSDEEEKVNYKLSAR